MFIHQELPFGKLKKHVIFDEAAESGFEVVPQHGATLLKLVMNGVHILDGYSKPEELHQNRWGKSNILIPFPNRLKSGNYRWQGEHYSFDINDPFTGNALHGFGMHLPFHILKVEVKEKKARVICSYEYGGEKKAYPFPFTFAISYTFRHPNMFEVAMAFANQSASPIPVGMGWHPYFKLDDKIDDTVLHLPFTKMIGIDEHMIPTGKKYPFDDFVVPKKLGATILNNCFALPAEDKDRFEFSLQGAGGKLNCWQECGTNKFNYLQIFTHPFRHSIAIEPMTCNIDAFNNKEGLIELPPYETVNATFGVSLG